MTGVAEGSKGCVGIIEAATHRSVDSKGQHIEHIEPDDRQREPNQIARNMPHEKQGIWVTLGVQDTIALTLPVDQKYSGAQRSTQHDTEGGIPCLLWSFFKDHKRATLLT